MVTPVLLLSGSYSYSNDPKAEEEKNVTSDDANAKKHEAVRVVKVVAHNNGSVQVQNVSPRMEIVSDDGFVAFEDVPHVELIPTTEVSAMDMMMHDEWFNEVNQ